MGKKEKKKKTYKKKSVQEAQKKKEKKGKTPKRSALVRSDDAIRVSAKEGQCYAKILKVINARVDPSDAKLKVLTIRRTRKKEVLLVLKKGAPFKDA